MAVWLTCRLAACFRKDMLHLTDGPDLLGSSTGSYRHGVVGRTYGSDLRKSGASHRCIGGWYPKGATTRSVSWSLNYIREEHNLASLGILQELLGFSTGNCRRGIVGRGFGPNLPKLG